MLVGFIWLAGWLHICICSIGAGWLVGCTFCSIGCFIILVFVYAILFSLLSNQFLSLISLIQLEGRLAAVSSWHGIGIRHADVRQSQGRNVSAYTGNFVSGDLCKGSGGLVKSIGVVV